MINKHLNKDEEKKKLNTLAIGSEKALVKKEWSKTKKITWSKVRAEDGKMIERINTESRALTR